MVVVAAVRKAVVADQIRRLLKTSVEMENWTTFF
jgi:hypothetical protein